mmetsp:Transcript_17699/g.31898  ORF Transcript_17699/g.31898 Transcript_17699/m.31898 type:complete len:266 (+) Transcript_17699:7098-7895(+)
MSIASGFAVNFWMLLIPRVVCAMTSVGSSSISWRLIGLFFPPDSRGWASGIFILSIFIGNALTFLTLPLLNLIGWRLIYIAFGASGTAISLLIGLVLWREYEFTEIEEEDMLKSNSQSASKDFFMLLRTNKTLMLTTLAFSMRAAGGFAKSLYEPLYFAERFPSYTLDYCFISFGATTFSAFGPPVGGYISDLKERTNPKWRPFLCCVSSIVAIPLYAVVYTTSSFPLAMALLYIASFIGGSFMSISGAITLNVSPSHMKAFGSL